MGITSLDNTFVASTYGRFPIELDHGKGAKLIDTNGKEYIDMGTGIAVNVFGVCDDEWTAAVKAQLNKLAHTSNLYYSQNSRSTRKNNLQLRLTNYKIFIYFFKNC